MNETEVNHPPQSSTAFDVVIVGGGPSTPYRLTNRYGGIGVTENVCRKKEVRVIKSVTLRNLFGIPHV